MRVIPIWWASVPACSVKLDRVTKMPAVAGNPSRSRVPPKRRTSSTPTAWAVHRLHCTTLRSLPRDNSKVNVPVGTVLPSSFSDAPTVSPEQFADQPLELRGTEEPQICCPLDQVPTSGRFHLYDKPGDADDRRHYREDDVGRDQELNSPVERKG